METSTQRIARRFLAIGGRFVISPEGKPDFGMNFAPLLSLKTGEPERRRLKRVARAACRLVEQRGPAVAEMVREAGSQSGAWIVWEGC